MFIHGQVLSKNEKKEVSAGRVMDVGLLEDMIASQRDVEMVLFFIDSLFRRSSQRLEIVGARRS